MMEKDIKLEDVHPQTRKLAVAWGEGLHLDMINTMLLGKQMQHACNQQTKESLSTIRSLALQLDRKGVKTLIDEIDKMIGDL